MDSSAAYFIDAEYRVLGFNDVCGRRFPQLKAGEYCYRCLQNKEAPCSVCPVKNNIREPRSYVDPVHRYLETVEALDMPLPDGTMGHCMVIRFPEDGMALPSSATGNELRLMNVIQTLGDRYTLIFNLDCVTGVCRPYRIKGNLPEDIMARIQGEFGYREVLNLLLDRLILPEDRCKLTLFAEPEAVKEDLKTRPGFTVHCRVMGEKYVHFYAIRFARVGNAENFRDVLIAVSCEDDERKASPALALSTEAPSLRRKILVVEDDFLNREMLRQMLSPDYDLLCAEDGEEGIRLLSKNYRQLSLVILDVYMPKCDGFQFLTRTRSDPLLAAVPVIVATGSNRPEDEARCLELGAMDFITKPYSLRGVQGRIRNLIKLRESTAMLTEIEFDSQTGLYTRQAFSHHASLLLNTDPPGTYQIVLVDIDNFRQVNSIYGENVGDDVIRFLAEELKKQVPTGLVAHYEGDNFVFMEPVGRSLEELSKLMHDISKRSPVRRIRFKCGVCLCDDRALPVSVICNRAFLALNSIKQDANKLAASFDDPINQRLCRERDMEGGFEDAIQNEEFVVWYQPKFDAHSEQLVGAEALVRWRKKDGSVVSPGEFIPLFEWDGLIVRLDEYVFRKVCQMQRFLLDSNGRVLPISVNLSRSSLHYPGMIERYARIVKEYRLDAQMVPIELTESSGTNMNQIKALAEKMVELGFPLHMDDFGAGYSSLGNLNALPFHTLKLDKSLIDYIGNPRGDQVLWHIIALAHGLGMEVLAEGVETGEQLCFLREVGCDLIQGYYFSKPLPKEQFLNRIHEWDKTNTSPGLQARHTLVL